MLYYSPSLAGQCNDSQGIYKQLQGTNNGYIPSYHTWIERGKMRKKLFVQGQALSEIRFLDSQSDQEARARTGTLQVSYALFCTEIHVGSSRKRGTGQFQFRYFCTTKTFSVFKNVYSLFSLRQKKSRSNTIQVNQMIPLLLRG